ncbi:MAG: 1,6-dihydroxycyclohexa-2,4-diene-1-carboxylate dehydrogenase [Gammaproteobacteria bacterium]|nr:MAG: 1,6-dihydroxycyclohexa-2,4-diene-1-carboxylate dehydrogenase [Gammaproteobacteria bacterium]
MGTEATTACRRFESKVAVVTGAAQGIGFATALRLGLEGASVVVVDRAEGPASDAVAALKARNIPAVSACADLGNYEGAERAMESAVAEFGGIDVLVNNVGGTVWKKPFWFYTEEEIQLEVERSFWPPLWCCRAAVPIMIQQKRGGSIINVGSNATEGIFRIPYSASKGGVAALSTALAIELADFDIRVNCVSPGATEVRDRKTERAPSALTEQDERWTAAFYNYIKAESLLGRSATVDEQAAVIAFLASDDASYVTGEVIDTGKRGMSISRGTGSPADLPG